MVCEPSLATVKAKLPSSRVAAGSARLFFLICPMSPPPVTPVELLAPPRGDRVRPRRYSGRGGRSEGSGERFVRVLHVVGQHPRHHSEGEWSSSAPATYDV